MSVSSTSARERFNWGYWDGRHDQERGKFAPWCGPCQTSGHPFDRIYGQGYWAGRYADRSETTSDAAWARRRPLNKPRWAA